MLSTTKLLMGAGEKQMDEQMSELNEFMLAKHIKKGLRVEINHKMEQIFRRKTVFDEGTVVGMLPGAYREKMLLAMYKDNIHACPLFDGVPEEVTVQLCFQLRPYMALQDEEIHTEGRVSEEMYMIVKGQSVRIYSLPWS